MSDDKTTMIKLSDMALELKINKSKLNYYAWLGLLPQPIMRGKLATYNHEQLLTRLKRIKELQRKKKELPEIKEIINNENN